MFCQIIRIYTFKPKNIQKSPNFFVEKGNILSLISSFSKKEIFQKKEIIILIFFQKIAIIAYNMKGCLGF
jgi:hypothetical protein